MLLEIFLTSILGVQIPANPFIQRHMNDGNQGMRMPAKKYDEPVPQRRPFESKASPLKEKPAPIRKAVRDVSSEKETKKGRKYTPEEERAFIESSNNESMTLADKMAYVFGILAIILVCFFGLSFLCYCCCGSSKAQM